MNGIIHACTHPNDNDLATGLTLREMMLAIFRYIDRMVTEIAKPKKILFMAIDGCAPRAKMNQQRSRRFRAAQDRLDMVAKAREKGEVVDEENMFDSNCITPGTEFMEQVGKHLRWFIRKKMKEDPIWKHLEVTFSGHDVPGEGEHKIMQFIRELRAMPDYQPNVRHCMYGQDADLIMLGLATHEPHFTLLREVVNFNTGFSRGASARSTVMRQTKEAQFQLLNLAVLREYIEVDLALGCRFAVDKERLCDDFIFLTFLVGNDFLPHLPTLDIGEHAFDLVFTSYKELLEEKEGYLVHNGELGDLERLEKLFEKIGRREAEILENREVEEKKFVSKRRKFKDENVMSEEEVEEAEEALQQAYEEAIQEALGNTPLSSASPSVEAKKDDVLDGLVTSSKDYRGRYYFEKFKVVPGVPKSTEFLDTLMEKYLEGLMWCLAYYIKGCISWTWYYPYHYGPMLIDMRGLVDKSSRIVFDLGQPFRPFQQLLGCLPPPSRRLLPRVYQWIMTSTDSPMIEFYPLDFKIDQDGKKNPWEAVVLLPFIDEKTLITAEKAHCREDALTTDERARNAFGKVLTHRFDPNVTETYYSCNPEIGLPDVPKCQTFVVESEPDYKPGAFFKPELVPGTAPCLAGFPSLGALRISNVETDSFKINVFGSDSKYKTVAIELDHPEYDVDQIDIRGLLGILVFINYPQLHEAKVVAVSNEKEEYRLTPCKDPAFPGTFETYHTKFDAVTANKWKKDAVEEETKYLKGRGIAGTGGLCIGEVKIRLRVLPLQGMKRDSETGANKKVYGVDEADIPIQMALWSAPVVDERFLETEEMPVAALYPHGCSVVGTTGKFKGYIGRVVGPHTEEESKAKAGKPMTAQDREKPRSVEIEFSIPLPEPPFGYMIEASIKEDYFSSRDIVKCLQISPSLLGKIVGSLFVDRVDCGLNLKRNGQYFLLGYVREVVPSGSTSAAWGTIRDSVRVIGSEEQGRVDGALSSEAGAAASNTWEYSAKAVALILDYKTQFPILFDSLERLGHERKYTSTQIFGFNGAKDITRVDEWLNSQFTAKAPRTPLSTISLSKEAMKAIERAADVRTSHLAANPPEKFVVKKVPLDAIYRVRKRCSGDVLTYYYIVTRQSLTHPMQIYFCFFQGDVTSQFDAPLLYNLSCNPRLGDRVVNLNSLGVPFGLKGTVITIHNATGYVEVVFDSEFVGGRALAGSCSQFRGRLCPWHGLLRVSKDEEAAMVGSTGLGTSSASKQPAQFVHTNAKPKAVVTAPAIGRDGHIMGMHPIPTKKMPSGGTAPGTVQEIIQKNKDLVASNVVGPPVTFASGPPPAVKYNPPKPPAVAAVEAVRPAEPSKSILGLLKKQLQISPPTAPVAQSSSDAPLPSDVQEAGRVSISMGGFRILRRAAGLPDVPSGSAATEAKEAQADERGNEEDDEDEDAQESFVPPAPPAMVLEPVVPSDGTGRAALALAAGLEENKLPPLPQVPLEPPMAGVIQINTFAKPINKPALQSLKARGFFSSAPSASSDQRPPSPAKRVLNPSVKPSSRPPVQEKSGDGAAEAAPASTSSGDPNRPPASASVAEKLAYAKTMMAKRKAAINEAGGASASSPAPVAASDSAAAPADAAGISAGAEAAAPMSLMELERSSSAAAAASASVFVPAPTPAPTKKMVPVGLLLKKAALEKKG